MNQIYLVNMSGVLASAFCWLKAIQRFGRENVVARFADTATESPDTYEFIDRVERVAKQKLVRLTQNKDIWDIFMERGMLYAPKQSGGGCVASYWLKRVPLDEHAKQFPEAIILVGFGPDECDRVERLEKHRPDQEFDYPLRWKPRTWACDARNYLFNSGVRRFPKAYDEGMGHNNCNRQCINGGIGYWSLLWRDHLNRYLYNEGREQDFLAMLRSRGRKEITILRDRRGGTTKNYSLHQLRLDLESGARSVRESQRHPAPCACDIQTQNLLQLN